MKSPYELLKDRPADEQKQIVEGLPDAVVEQMAAQAWWFLARPEQLPPTGDWSVWLLLAGRGFGKTRTAAEWLAQEVIAQPSAPDGTPTEWAIVAETFGDTREVCVDGPSGIMLALARHGYVRGQNLSYNRSSWQIILNTGQRIHMLGADDKDVGRGLNLAGLWADEIAKWRYPYESWTEGLAPALRIGKHPRSIVSTTPKPNKLLIEWLNRTDGSVAITRGSTFDNAANLSPAALRELETRYEGTRLGAQELYGELLLDVEGALWQLANITQYRVPEVPDGRIVRIVVAVDPSVTSTEDSAETGIIVALLHENGHGYVLADRSMRASPDQWARRVVATYEEFSADAVVVESNQGGDLNKSVLHTVDPNLPIRMVHAGQGKRLRAEPIAALYEQGKVHHVGQLPTLEDQLCSWVPGDVSPDRLDALVWALTALMLNRVPPPVQTFRT